MYMLDCQLKPSPMDQGGPEHLGYEVRNDNSVLNEYHAFKSCFINTKVVLVILWLQANLI